MTNETTLRETFQRTAATLPDDDRAFDDIVRRGRRRRTRNRLATGGGIVAIVAAIGIGVSTIQLPGAGEVADDPDVEVADVPAATEQVSLLDGRSLTITAPEGAVGAVPTDQALRLQSDTLGLRVVTSDAAPGSLPPDTDAELVEDRWAGELTVAATSEGVPVGFYSDGTNQLVLSADRGPSLEPITSVDEFLDALERIDIARSDAGPVVTFEDAFDRTVSLTYEVSGIDAPLQIQETPQLTPERPIQPIEDPIEGVGGEVIVGQDNLLQLTTPQLVAQLQLILPDDAEQQRAIDLLRSMELELQD